MQVHIHPFLPEVLTVKETIISRWSLTSSPVILLNRINVEPEMLFEKIMLQDGREVAIGGTSGNIGDTFFALAKTLSRKATIINPSVIDYYSWEALVFDHQISVAQVSGSIETICSSADGLTLLITTMDSEYLFIIDAVLGTLVARYASAEYISTCLSMDPTSTFVAGLFCHDNGGYLKIWQIIPATLLSSFMQNDATKMTKDPISVTDPYVLYPLHAQLDRKKVAWPERDLADTYGVSAFSPDSQTIVFSLVSAYSPTLLDFTAYNVLSGQLLWHLGLNWESGGCFAFTPDSNFFILSDPQNILHVFSAKDGKLQYQVIPDLESQILSLFFDHDKTILWLVTAEAITPLQWNKS